MIGLSRKIALTLALSLAVASCGGADNPVAPAASVVGTWELRSVDGDPLPAVTDAVNGWEVLSEIATFSADQVGSPCSSERCGQVDLDGQQRHTASGFEGSYGSAWQWDQSGAQVILSGDEGGVSTIAGDILTRHAWNGHTYVYFRL